MAILAPMAEPDAKVLAAKVVAAVVPLEVLPPIKLRNAEPAGDAVTRTLTVNVSDPVVVNGAVTVIGVELTTPICATGIVPIVTAVGTMTPSAFAGATEVKTPKPNAAIVTSEIRLNIVFVDIYFLSFSRFTEFP
jgi:hypothetical protein